MKINPIFLTRNLELYLTLGFIASTRAFSILTGVFSVLTRGFFRVIPRFELVTRRI